MPATDVTIEHYTRPEVREIILRYCQYEHGSRALNSDEHWYRGTDDINHTVALRGPADYTDTIKRGRTLYATLDILEQAVFEQDSKWDKKAGRPETPLGTLAECLAFTLSTDIDGTGDIRSLAVKQAVEAAAQFHVDYLRERGIEKSVYCLYSGGGIYVHLHHGLFAVDVGNTELTPEARKEQYQILCKAYNRIIGEISQAFFRKYPQYIGLVKFDQLNNQKRTFKTIFSIHKRLPYAVIPLDPKAIEIDFGKASLPLSSEVLQEGAQWYQSFDPSEKEAVMGLLKDKIEAVRAVTRDRPSGSADGEISRPEEPLGLADFAPCMKNIIEKAEDHEGRHRALAVLSTYLYQMGWPEDRAFDLWLEVADRCGVESRIFETTFGLVSCPLCSTMLQDTGGYPHLNLFNMGFCVPDEHCKGCQWPGDHHLQKILNENFDKPKAEKPKGPTVLDALKAMLEHDSEVRTDKESSTWEWRVHKPRMERAVKAGWMTRQAEEKAHKFLGKYKKNLESWGIAYDNLFPLPPKENKEEFSDEIRAKALRVLKDGDPMRYVVDSCGRTVLGADTAFKKVACCISAQNIRQSAGLHPKLTGASSGGKTYTIYTFANHLPYEAVIKGSMSAKAGFYHSDGNRVFRILDDYQPGNEDLDTVIKQTTSEFHDTYAHRTVANHAAQTLKIGSEQTWAITSVNNDQDIQVLNRGLPINVDDSEETTEKVNKRTVERYGTGEPAKLADEQVLVSRCIFQILRDEGYINVRIPFYDRINWIDKSNRRNPSIFMDLVIAHTALYRFQREQDSEGYYLATEEDFQAAKALFTDDDSEELVKRLTRREREVLEELVSNPDGVTRSDLSEALGIAPQQVSQILGGQKGLGGLMQKVAIKETKLSEMMRINEEQSRTIHKTVYSLKDYDKLAGFDAVVRLEPKPQQETTRNRRKEDESKDESKSTNSRKEDESKESKRKREREEREKREESSSSVGEESTLSREEQENTFVTFAMEPDSEKDTFVFTSSTLSPEEDESKLVVRFRTDYRTDRDGKMHDFKEGDEFEVARWRAESWAKRGIVDIVEATSAKPLRVIYKPKGAALEYSGYGLNLYNGCSHKCSYCYNKPRFNDRYPCDQPRKAASLEAIEADLRALGDDKTPVHLSFVGDPYDLGRQDNSYVRKVLHLFKKYDHPFQVLTKGGTKAVQDFDLYGEGCRFGATLTFINDADSLKWEPGAALPADRIEALRIAHERGIMTWASLEPVIDPAQTLRLIELTHDFVDDYGVGKLNHSKVSIDWGKFRTDAEILLAKCGSRYMIKRALLDATKKTAEAGA